MSRSAALRSWQAAGRAERFGQHSTFVMQGGDGPPLLLLHGFPTASYDWQPIWSDLCARFTVIAPDFLGYGLSDKPRTHDYHVNDHADHVEELMTRCGFPSYGVLAHDYGDTVAQELLARDLERAEPRVRYVCFLNGGLFPEKHRPRLIQKLLLWPTGPLITRLLSERKFNKSFSEVFGADTQPSAEFLRDCWALVEHNDGRLIYHRLIRYITQRYQNRDRWVGALQQSRVPLRLINGTDDPVSGRHAAERYHELIPNPDVVLLEGIGHYPQVETPAQVSANFLTFAERHA